MNNSKRKKTTPWVFSAKGVWQHVWFAMAGIYKYAKIAEQEKAPDRRLTMLVKRFNKAACNLVDYVDTATPNVVTMSKLSEPLSALYRKAKQTELTKISSTPWREYRLKIVQLLKDYKLPADDKTVAAFALDWIEITDYRTPVEAARTVISKLLDMPRADKTIRSLINNRAALPSDDEITTIDFLRNLLKSYGNFSDGQIEGALLYLKYDFNKIQAENVADSFSTKN